ncbi:MAG: glycosyl hydrolase [Sulfurimonas sp. RIFCSPLOWO2_12_FULL_36_74]|uniref:glycoside hydrolase family 3 protein n=1 Tax=Sulfurimonas sp. RIFCSPLOWO2_12_36_12 TaxID=1802253 RepID=UPI0008ADA99C|nr:glycoside hydrolase family 3 N-terminal domain-containing protein [Sulfurimonas sp. RIFCSPLOWO2_12_36_12]OHE00613.1 MAG: glycosyl hydrolase [Sulfurimonas sp. RIFCSPLOWO2_12_36_12]OHE06753.1 MAG: glycosyl hydrolase [Sulfurimonas sp. RIFCSPLOWO2_12_FULL_36_74]
MKLITLFFVFALSSLNLSAATVTDDDEKLKKMIGRMLIVGFPDEVVDENSPIARQIKSYELGGVILFDRFYNDRNKTKNISSPEQLQLLTSKLKSFSSKPLLISVDQEGGKVARLKPAYGFEATPSAKVVSELDEYMTKHIYNSLAKTLKNSGINCDFAPVVDLAINRDNRVIVGLNRSYGSDSKEVVKYAKIFMNSLKNEKIISVLKHFPGHGSSLNDSHEGFVDISNTWSEVELEPYEKLIKSGDVSMIMTAHVFNSELDDVYPATLSYKVNTELLRGKLGYDGVVVSDDLQMGAILKHYSLKEIVTLSINSGVDMLLFGNQLSTQDIDELVEVILAQVKSGAIPLERVLESNRRVELLHKKNELQ